ncbi:MAG: glycosyltransferase [Bdellovibrionales bacterium]
MACTGGHVYPALAIAEAFKRKHKEDVEIHFIGTARGLESKVVPEKGYPLHLLNMGRFAGVSRYEKLMTLLFLPIAFLQAFLLIVRYRPRVVLGVEWHASVPAIR